MTPTVTNRLLGTMPAWAADPAPEVIMRHRSGSVSSRRPYPVAKNDPFVPRMLLRPEFTLEGVGEGNDVYLEPEDDAAPGSEEAKHRVKRLRNIGEGSRVLKQQADGDLDNELRSVKESPGSQISVTESAEELLIRGTGVSGSTQINIGGILSFGADGMATVVLEGERGTTGELSIVNCNGSTTKILEWREGQITSNSVSFQVGDCGGGGTTTYVPGP